MSGENGRYITDISKCLIEWLSLHLDSNFTEIFYLGSINKRSTLDLPMAWRRTRAKSLPKSMLTMFYMAKLDHSRLNCLLDEIDMHVNQ